MREDYEDTSSGFNPLKVGIIGAVIVAVLVGGVLQYRSYSEKKQAARQELQALQDDLEKAKKENQDLQKKLETLQEESKSAQSKLEKMLKLKDSQLVSTVREKDSDARSADTRIAELKKAKEKVEGDLAQVKKDSDARAAELKKSQDQVSKLQADLKAAKSEADRYSRDAKALQAKLNKINEGEEAAANQIVQQLSEARQQLKKEQAARLKVQQELESLKQQTQANPQ